MQANAKSHSGYVQISQQPLAAHGPNMCCSSSPDFTGNEKHGHLCGDAAHVHQPCQRVWWIRVLIAMAAVFLLFVVSYAVFSRCSKGSGAEGVWESVVGLVKRATSSTSSTTSTSSNPFVQNKLYLIVAIVGFVLVVILAIMLSACCCRESFKNPLCCPCYLCACCGGLACLECIGCGLCAVADIPPPQSTMDVDSIASPVLATPISNCTLSPNCESQQQPYNTSHTSLTPPRIPSPRQSAVISDVATRRFPLTAALAKNALESEKGIRVASPSSEDRIEKSTLDMFEYMYYNSRGELVIPIENLPPPCSGIYSGSSSPSPYDALGYFHIINPPQPPKTTQSSSRNSNIPTSVFQPLPTIPQPAQRIPTKATIRLCKTKDCNAIIPFKHYKWHYCKRCTTRISQSNADPHSRDGSNTHPSPFTSVALQLRFPDPCIQSPPSFTIPTSFRQPIPVRSASVSTVRSVSGSGSRRSTLSSSPITTDTSHSSNVAPNGAPNANIESVTIGQKRSRCVTEPILASTSSAEPPTVLAVTEAPEPTRPNPPTLPSISRIPPRRAEPHNDSQSQTRPSQKTKRKTRPLPKPTPAADSLVSSSSAPAPAPAGPPLEKLSDPWLLRITAGTEQRKCITPCTNMIPLSSSPYTLRCPSCVKVDWIARKRGVETLMQESRAKKTMAKSEVDEKEMQEMQDKKDKNDKLCAKRRDSGSSINSLLSLSSLTSLEDSEEETETQLNATSTICVSELDSIPSLVPTSTSKAVLKFPGEMWRRVRNLRYCSGDGCCKQLEEGYHKSICVRCQAMRRERMRVFGVSCTAVWGMRGVFGDLRGARSVKDDEEEEEEEAVTMGDVIQGARLCASRWCSHVLPTKEEYKWSMCLGCRSYLVKKGQQRDHECEEKKGRKKVWGGKLTSGRNADGAERRCSSLDCGMLVGDEEQDRRSTNSLCVQCMRRKAREAERAELVRTMMGTATSTSATEPEKEEAPAKPQSTCKASCYPEFISFSALIAQFRTELHSFLRDQAQLALRRSYMTIEGCESSISASCTTPATKPPETENVAPSLGPFFTFKGQSSTVCSTPNILSPSHRTAILSHLVYVRSELERASLLQLRPQNTENPLVVFKEGFAVRFVCMHAIPLGYFLSGEHGHSDANNHEKQRTEREIGEADIKKDIKGELDITVFPDHSHHILPGQTTMVKFRMGVINFS